MIKRLKIKLVMMTMIALAVILAFILVCMDLISYRNMVHRADSILTTLAQHNGSFPQKTDDSAEGPHVPRSDREMPYESRLFSVRYDENGNLLSVDLRKIASVDSQEAADYGAQVLGSSSSEGFVDVFRYRKYSDNGNTCIIFLDCENRLETFHSFVFTGILMSVIALLISFFVILYFSEKLLRPVALSYEKQARFIADAGHEIKTPLTIIQANLDMLQMDPQDQECLSDIRDQTQRLTELTSDMVCLARMDEQGALVEKTNIPISEVICDVIHPFTTLAQTRHKDFKSSIEPGLTMYASENSIRHLVGALLDNAFKYSPEGGKITAEFQKDRSRLILEITNDTISEVRSENLDNLFERFYRLDESRNSEIGGHGLGLSIARSIVEAHGGSIRAWTRTGRDFHISCIFRV